MAFSKLEKAQRLATSVKLHGDIALWLETSILEPKCLFFMFNLGFRLVPLLIETFVYLFDLGLSPI